MSFKRRLRTILMCAALELGVLSGVPMRPDEIRALMHQSNQPKVAHVLPADEEGGDDPPPPASASCRCVIGESTVRAPQRSPRGPSEAGQACSSGIGRAADSVASSAANISSTVANFRRGRPHA